MPPHCGHCHRCRSAICPLRAGNTRRTANETSAMAAAAAARCPADSGPKVRRGGPATRYQPANATEYSSSTSANHSEPESSSGSRCPSTQPKETSCPAAV
jgi:hypothetical protein